MLFVFILYLLFGCNNNFIFSSKVHSSPAGPSFAKPLIFFLLIFLF